MTFFRLKLLKSIAYDLCVVYVSVDCATWFWAILNFINKHSFFYSCLYQPLHLPVTPTDHVPLAKSGK